MKALFSLLIVTAILTRTHAATEKNQATFPNVEGKNLHGDVIAFPQFFASQDFTVVVVAFEQKQQEDVDSWLPSLIQLETQRADLSVLELPTIAKMNRLMRWIIYRGMRSGIKDSDARSRTITLHLEKAPFKKALNITSERNIRVYLISDKGTILWETQGLFTAEKLKTLTAQLPAMPLTP